MILVAHLTCPITPNVDNISKNLIERRIDAQVDEQEPKLRLRDKVAIGRRPIGSWMDSLFGASVRSDVGPKIPLVDHGALLAVVTYEQRLDARVNFAQCQVSSSARRKSREELSSPLA